MTGKLTAGLVGVIASVSSPAGAADLPTFLGVSPPAGAGCGAGALVVPGTSTCLRLDGEVWADLTLARPVLAAGPGPTPASRTPDISSLRSQGYLGIDTRTPTAMGMVRTYVSIRAK